MDAKDVFLNIAQNQANFSKVSQDTAANAINNEETFERPATYFMYSPEKDDIDKNGSLKVQGYRKMLESGSFDGAGATLANARLYSFFEPIQNELFEKEQEYKKFVFDNSSAFSQFGSDLMRNWYSLKKNEAIYKMAKAQQDGDLNSVLDYKYQIENLDKQISKYVTPEDGFVNTTANVLTSMARNAPELLAVSAGAAAVTYLTGGLGLPAYLTAAGATMANGAIIYNDTYKLEAGEILQELERTSPNMSLDERLAVAERYANLSALIEASGALFGLVGMGTRGITRLAAQFSKKAAGKLSTRTATKFIANVAKRKALRELIKLPLNEKLKNPKYIAYIGRKVGEHFFGAGGEALQEVTQENLQDAFVNAIMSGEDPNNIDLIDNIFEALKDGSNQSKYAQLFLNTFLASLFISGTTATAVTGAKTGVQKLMARSMQNMNADQVSQNIIDQKKKSVAYNKSPKAYGENTQEIINAGNAPETVAMDANNLIGVLDDAEKKGETTILQKLNELGITRDKLEKSIAGSGVFKIDFAQFDNVVLDPNDEGLFQKVKGQYTFDETTLTKKELEVLMDDLATKRPELKEAMQDKDSAFNITLNALMQNKNFTHKQAVINAMGAQLMVNRAATFKSENGEPVSFDVLNRTQKELGLTGADLLQTAYAGSPADTINIGGKERTVYNSNGERIAETKEALDNFYKWFGDSKVVDEQGRPLVVYHGTDKEFDKFDKSKKRTKLDGFFFTTKQRKEAVADYYAQKDGKVLTVYLSLKNPKIGAPSEVHGMKHDGIHDGYISIADEDFDDVKKGDIVELVVFEPNQIKSTGNVGTFSTDENNIFKQTVDSQQIVGMFSREYGKNIIKLTEAANPTTFMHEFMHMTMVEMLDAYNSGQMTDYWKKQTDAIAAFGGFEKDKNGLYITASSDSVANAKVIAAHERVADAFTTYLKEGKAPIESLADMFHQFMEWFVDVYKRLVMNDVKLNKSIRKAFDSLLVSKEEMDQAIIDKNLRAIGRRPGVSEDEYQSYLSDLSKLNRVSTNKHLEAIRRKQRIATEQKNKQKLDEIRKEVDAQVSQDPRYQLVDDIRARKINSADIPAGFKVRNESAFLRENGIPAEQFITDHESVVSNIADIVELLNNLEDKAGLVERLSQEQFSEWLNKEYPELADIDAKAAASNQELIKVRIKEYMMLMHIPMPQFKQYYNELIKAGDSEVESMKLRELTNVERLLDLETRIVTKARVAKTDTELANALWHQAAVDYIIMRAKDIKVQVNRFTRHFDKYKYLPSQAELKRIDAYDFDMITGILRNLGFTRKQPRVRDIPLGVRINEWVDDKMNSSFSSADEVRDYIPTLTMPTVDKFDNNTYHDFGTFDVLTRLIEGISRSDKELTEIDKTKLRQEDADAIIEYQAKKGINPSTLSWWTDMMVMKEQYLKKILPARQFLDYVSPFVQAHALREQRIAKNDEAAYGVLKDMIDSEKQLFTVPLASGGVLNMTYADMQVAVLNIDNMEKWIMSWNAQRQANLTEDDFLSIIEAAPQKMLDNAQTIWNVFDSQKKEFREAQYKINGFLMDYVEPRAITLSDGRTIQSGYYPSGKMPTSQKEFGDMIMSLGTNGVYNMATSKFAKDKKEGVVYDSLDLTINSLRSWLYHTATVIEIGPHFNKLSKLINETSLTNQLGQDVVKSLNDWMSYSIVGDNLNKFYASLDKISSVQILGWEPFRAVVQAFGWIPSMSTIGPQWIAPQFLRATSYTNIFSIKEAAKLSPYMRMRYENAINHIASVGESNQLIRTGKTLADKMMNVAMWFTAHGDAFSSYIVWNAAFEKATAEGYSRQEASDIADSAVRTSQGDSTGVSRPKILQGDKRVITKFASYFIAMNSRVSSAFVGKERVELVAMMMLAGIVAPIVEAYLRSGYEWFVGSDDDKKKWRKLRLHSFEDVMFYNMKQNVLSTIGQTSLPIAGIGGYIGNLLATGNPYDKPIPMLDYLYSVGKAVSYPALALTAETEREKKRYISNFEKSLLKSLTVPNKLIRMIVD